MDDQHKTQARNCITNYCFYPRTSANQLVAKMNDEELEAVLEVGDQVGKSDAEKKTAIDEILSKFTDRLEGEAKAAAKDTMQKQRVLHAASGKFGKPGTAAEESDDVRGSAIGDEVVPPGVETTEEPEHEDESPQA